MFDTHCHLNFKVFNKNLSEVIERAGKAGVNRFVIPGTDLENSKRAVEIAEKYEGVYAAVGIHPHHALNINPKSSITKFFGAKNLLSPLLKLIIHPEVVAIGEVGLDKHQYTKTKYQDYQIDPEFIERQKELLIEQIKLAKKYKKTIILHNREATEDILEILTNNQSLITNNQTVFHCCEPDDRLLEFAIKHKIFIGVDGDVTYREDKQSFVKKIPLDLLVLETDSPFLFPRLRQGYGGQVNEPKNLPIIAEFIANLRGKKVDVIQKKTEKNSKNLFF